MYIVSTCFGKCNFVTFFNNSQFIVIYQFFYPFHWQTITIAFSGARFERHIRQLFWLILPHIPETMPLAIPNESIEQHSIIFPDKMLHFFYDFLKKKKFTDLPGLKKMTLFWKLHIK